MFEYVARQKKYLSIKGFFNLDIRRAIVMLLGLNCFALFLIALSLSALITQSFQGGLRTFDFHSEASISSLPLAQKPKEILSVDKLSFSRNSSLTQTFIKGEDSLAIINSTLFAVRGNSLEVYNVSNPKAPTSLRLYFNYSFTGGILAINNLLFCAIKQDLSEFPYSLNIYDCSNVTNLCLIRSYPQTARVSRFGLYKNHLFVLSNILRIYNLSVANPSAVYWSWTGNETTILDLAVSRDTLFLSTPYYLYSFALGDFLAEPVLLYAFNESSIEEVYFHGFTDKMILFDSMTLGIYWSLINSAVLVFNISQPDNITLQKTYYFNYFEELYISYSAPFLFTYVDEQLNIYRFISFEGDVSLYQISYFRDYLNEKLRGKILSIDKFRFYGVVLKEEVLFLWRKIYTPEKFILYCLDFSSPLEGPRLLFRGAFTDTILLYANIIKGILLIIPGLCGVFIFSRVGSWIKRKITLQKGGASSGEQSEEQHCEKSEFSPTLNKKDYLKLQKIFLVASILFLCCYVLKIIFEWEILSLGSSSYITGKNVGYYYSISQYFDLSAALLFTGGFLWHAFLKRQWKFIGISLLWLAWFSTTLCFRLLWGFPSYRQLFSFLASPFYCSPSFVWLYNSQSYFIFYSLSIVLFGCNLFFLRQILSSTKKSSLLLLTFIFLYWISAIFSLYRHFSFIQKRIFAILLYDYSLLDSFMPVNTFFLKVIVPLGMIAFLVLIIDLCCSIKLLKEGATASLSRTKN
ncbi:MAG: hypothetical protein ACTSV6_03460 [Candidatus Heimdallarchaeota archaeon]